VSAARALVSAVRALVLAARALVPVRASAYGEYHRIIL